MGHRPASETNRFPASQENPCVLMNPTAFYRVHKSLPIIRFEPDKSSPFQAILFEIHCNIIHPPTPPAVSEGIFFLQVMQSISCTYFSSPTLAVCPGHLIFLDFHNLIIQINSLIVHTEINQGL
jgi:hypothetical protein